MANRPDPRSIVVVGGGIVGVNCALRLQQDGFSVTIIDREDLGSQCSYGAAANLGGNAQFILPGILWRLPKMILNPLDPFSIRWRNAIGMLPWLYYYVRNTEASRGEAIGNAAMKLGADSFRKYQEILAPIGQQGLVQRHGRLFVWTGPERWERDQMHVAYRQQRGVGLKMLSGDEIREMEPAIGSNIYKGVYAEDASHIVNPLRLVGVLAEMFIKAGGKIVRDEVRSISTDAADDPVVIISSGNLRSHQVILAAGVWSGKFAKSLGSYVPLVAERGYHAMLHSPGISLGIPTVWEDRKIIFTPMEEGIRANGMAEFASIDAKPRYALAERLRLAAAEVFPTINVKDNRNWMGCRPSTPDHLPVIGRSPRSPRIIYAFGHAHSGFNLGPATAKAISELASGKQSSFDLSPYRPDRW